MTEVKRKVFEAALCTGVVVDVTVIASEGLDLPASVQLPALLQYGLAMPVPIPDIDAGPTGIRATLSFSRTPVPTFVPWDAVARMSMAGVMLCHWEVKVEQVEAEPPARPKLGLVS